MVYVDDARIPMQGRRGPMMMGHMLADTLEELHTMADAIGVARKHFQGDHYDVCLMKRRLAVRLGAKFITVREMVAIRHRVRGTDDGATVRP